MIHQLKSIIDDIEISESQSEKIRKSFELCELVFDSTKIDDDELKNLVANDLLIDPILSLDKVSSCINTTLSGLLQYLDKELKGSDFEKEIQSRSHLLESLINELPIKQKQYQDLQVIAQNVNTLQLELDRLQAKIAQYNEIDLDQMEGEKKELQAKLQELERTQGNNLMIYQKHLKANENIDISSDEIEILSSKIENDLSSMDLKYKDIIELKNNK